MSSPAPQFESIDSLELNLHHVPTLTSVHDYWKNRSTYTVFKNYLFYLCIRLGLVAILLGSIQSLIFVLTKILEFLENFRNFS